MSAAPAARRLLKLDPRLLRSRTKRAAGVTGNKVLFSSSAQTLSSEGRVTIHFITQDGQKITTSGAEGHSLLDVVVDQKLNIPGYGACEGCLVCSTCHVILDQEVFDQLGDIAEEELDTLVMTYGVTDTSRLGCQVCLSKSLEGMTVRVPEGVRGVRQADTV